MKSLVCNVGQPNVDDGISTADKSTELLLCDDLVGSQMRRSGNVVSSEEYQHTVSTTGAPARNLGNVSPYPELDAYVCEIASSAVDPVTSRPAGIRSWSFFPEYMILIYNISNNRFCYNIGREHKSNGVYYVVDFRINVIYQRCYDHDCRGFKSDGWELPASMRIEDGRGFGIRDQPDGAPRPDAPDGDADEQWWDCSEGPLDNPEEEAEVEVKGTTIPSRESAPVSEPARRGIILDDDLENDPVLWNGVVSLLDEIDAAQRKKSLDAHAALAGVRDLE